MRDFPGYDKPAQIVPRSNLVASLQTAVPTNPPLPGARYRSFLAATTVNVWDGQTVVLGGPMQESDPSQKQSTNTQRQNLLIFITPTLIDPAGNRLHTAEDMPMARPQPGPNPPK